MSATTTVTNGKPQRKQLSDQLDRLDAILDAIAEGLPGAVTDACREGARAAVKDAIIEIVTNPELRALLGPAAPAPAVAAPAPEPEPQPKKPGLWGRLRAKLAAARDAVTGTVAKAKEAVTSRCQMARDAVATLGQAAGEALPWKRMLWVSAGVGLAVGVACLVVPQTVAAVVGAVSASATAVAVQAGNWLKRAGQRFGLVS
jgi:hypothetical protein